MKTDFPAWMALETPSRWNNDSADHIDIEEAEESGAVGVTTNPPLTHAVLSQYSELYRNEAASIDSTLREDCALSFNCRLVGDRERPSRFSH